MIDTKELCESHPKLISSIENSIDTRSIVYQEDNIDVSPKT
jgi:hypothetical protein